MAIGAIAAAYAEHRRASRRIASAKRSNLGLGGRSAIWRETWPMVQGLLADRRSGRARIERGMIVYQQHRRGSLSTSTTRTTSIVQIAR